MFRIVGLILLAVATAAVVALPIVALASPDGERDVQGYRWVMYPHNPGQAFLIFGGQTVGGWDFAGQYYRAWQPYADEPWSVPRKRPPIAPPAGPHDLNPAEPQPAKPQMEPKKPKPHGPDNPVGGPQNPDSEPKADTKPCPKVEPAPSPKVKPKEAELPTGVDTDKLTASGEPRYWHRGTPVDRSDVLAAIGQKKTVPDDRLKLRLTVIGTDAERAAALKDLPQDLQAKVNVWSIAPDHWSLKDMGYQTDGHPTIYLQSPDGRVLWRQDSYGGAGDYEAIRKRVAEYDAKKDPGPGSGGNAPVGPLAWLGAAAGALWLATRKTPAPA